MVIHQPVRNAPVSLPQATPPPNGSALVLADRRAPRGGWLGPHGGEAVRGGGGHGAAPALVCDTRRAAVRMGRRGRLRIAEDVVGEGEQGAESSG